MTTYQISINDTVPAGKSILALLQSLPDVVSLQEITSTSNIHTELKQAFKDVSEIKNGKQKRQTLRELIDEL